MGWIFFVLMVLFTWVMSYLIVLAYTEKTDKLEILEESLLYVVFIYFSIGLAIYFINNVDHQFILE